MKERLINIGLAGAFVLTLIAIGYWFLDFGRSPSEPEVQSLADLERFHLKPNLKPSLRQETRDVKKKPLELLNNKNVSLSKPQKPRVPNKLLPQTRFPKGLKRSQVYFKVIPGGYAVAFGDVIMGKLSPEQQGIEQGAFEPKKPSLWPSNVIPYQIAEGVDRQIVMQALEYFHNNTPIQFVPLAAGDRNGILFTPTEEHCASLLGMVGGIQPILLSGNCGQGQILHEIMHALGFVHEHSRQERDQFLEINWGNILPEFLSQFNMIPDTLVHNYSGSVFSFDYESIMLYPENAFAKQPSLKTLKSKTGNPIRPRSNELSKMDKERVYYLYGY